MSSARVRKRSIQACVGCRRKKVKCPGEKPSCSSCLRLNQTCRYASNPAKGAGSMDVQLIDRLSRLEEQMNRILPDQEETSVTMVDASQSTWEADLLSSAALTIRRQLPDKDILNRAFEVYTKYCHRQPIWLFDDLDGLMNWASDGIRLMVLMMAMRIDTDLALTNGLKIPSAYASLVRNHLSITIANGVVTFDTLQTLCLLSYHNYTENSMPLARLHLNLAQNLLYQSGLDGSPLAPLPTVIEKITRLNWSIHILELLFAPPIRALCITDTFQSRYVYFQRRSGESTRNGPQLPIEDMSDRGVAAVGMWLCLIQTLNLWREVRFYVAECAQGRNESPWVPSSTYLHICSQLNEIESSLPPRYRYKNAKFADRGKEEVRQDQHFWYAWINMQMTYHAIHAVLNHPFLYGQKESKHKRGPNMFWRNSSELALLHSVWISRLINMANEQDLYILDPHVSRVAAIAATLHLYHSAAADETIRNAALINLDTCLALVRRLGQIWPLSQQLVVDLDALILQSSWQGQNSIQNKLSLNTALMWAVIGYDPPATYRLTRDVFHPSFPRYPNPFNDEDTPLGLATHHREAIEICRPDRNEATSPTWDQDQANEEDLPPQSMENAYEADAEQDASYHDALTPWINDHHTFLATDCGDFMHAFDLDGGDPRGWEIGTL